MHRRHCIVATLASAALGLCLPVQAAAAKTTAAPTTTRTILVVGDSLSAEYGIARGSGWVALLEQRLAQEKKPWKVVNASISGDTTAGGRSRIAGLLRQHHPAVVVIELGANDALRGLPLPSTSENLRSMVQAAKAGGARVLLLGMQVPPNYGQSYARKFAEGFVEISREQKAALVPFLLKGIADGPDAAELFQPDRIHPRAEAHPRMLENVWPALEPLLR